MDYFKNIAGNPTAKAQLNHEAATGTIAHAYLFRGQSGTGKFTFALELAKVLIPAAAELENPENHPDLHIINTDAPTIKKGQIEELIEEAGKTAFEKETQVFLIKDFEKVTPEGQNALLKTLEEPKKGVHILLTTSAPEEVLPTIRSRCRPVSVYPLSREETERYLRKLDKNLTTGEIRLYAKLSDGNLKEARSYVENPDLLLLRKEGMKELLKLCRGKNGNPFEAYKFFEGRKKKFPFLAKQYKLWFQDLMKLPYGGEPAHEDLLKDGCPVPRLETEQLYELWNVIDRTEQNLKRNGNFQLNVENMLLHIQGEYHDRSSGGKI